MAIQTTKKGIRGLLEGQEPLRVSPKATVTEAARAMAGRDVGAVVVVDGLKLVGIFTERDILKRIIVAGKDAARTRITDVMTPSPMTIDADEGIMDALTKMREARCRHLPVMDHGALLGVVSLKGLVMRALEIREGEIRALEEYLEYLPPDTSPGG